MCLVIQEIHRSFSTKSRYCMMSSYILMYLLSEKAYNGNAGIDHLDGFPRITRIKEPAITQDTSMQIDAGKPYSEFPWHSPGVARAGDHE
jgi:hypothetical protein